MERRKLHNLCVFSKQYLEAGTLAVRRAYAQVKVDGVSILLTLRVTSLDPQFFAFVCESSLHSNTQTVYLKIPR